MRVAVIGNYESNDYAKRLETVRLLLPDETIVDLGRHSHIKKWDKQLVKKFLDIAEAHLVVNTCTNWMDDRMVDVKIDLGEAENTGKEIAQLTEDGRLVPFNENRSW